MGMTFNEVYPQPGDFHPLIPQVWRSVNGSPAELAFLLGGDQSITDILATVIVGTEELGIPLKPGIYLDAQRDPFEASGHPGLSIEFDHNGCNVLTGEFTVTDASFAANNTASSFAFSFEQHCNDATPALFGTFTYNANATEVPEPAGYL